MPQGTERGGNYPLDNLTFDLITIMHKKSRALEAYDKYIEDAQADEEISELLEEMRSQDEDCVMQLQQHLVRLLGEQSEAGGSANRTAPRANAARAGSSGSAARGASAGRGGGGRNR